MKPVLCDYCKRERVKQNDTNWNRHIESCKKKHKCAIKDRKEIWIDFLIKNQRVVLVCIQKFLKCLIYLHS